LGFTGEINNFGLLSFKDFKRFGTAGTAPFGLSGEYSSSNSLNSFDTEKQTPIIVPISYQ